MTQNPNSENDDIASQLRDLGKNLVDTLHAAWESPERKRLQQELENGLTDLGATLNKEVDNFSQSPTGQRLRSDVKDVGQRIRSGEVTSKAREEMLSALRTVNAELEKLAQQLAGRQAGSGGSQERAPDTQDSPATGPEVHQEATPGEDSGDQTKES